jgi:peptide/nickel transport system ATP-binding protein
VAALDGVGFAIGGGGITALVGESGSGKTTLGRILIGLDQADAGRAEGFGHDLAHLPAARRPRALLAALGIVFQNPDATLNPAHSVRRILSRALSRAGRPADAAAVADLLARVRLPAAAAGARPAALSGGQRQRVAIARAYAGRPDLVIADEPVSALDLSVQAAIIELLRDRQAEQGGAILFISHDLELVRHIADQVVVLYRGRVVEAGPAATVLDTPAHPYTATLLAAAQLRAPVAAEPSAPADARLCPWLPQCDRATPFCARTPPPDRTDAAGRLALCHHPLPEGAPR